MRAEARRTTGSAAVVGAVLGVVFGDIGTSPIYTIQTAFAHNTPHPVQASMESVYGIASLIFWAVVLIVTVKYVLLVMRADDDGEGGTMALISQIRKLGDDVSTRRRFVLAGLGVFGAALFFGDSMITPAISVLSAVEGLETIEPSLDTFVLPTTVTIVVLLFVLQRLGSGAVGRLFGPIMLVWFLTIAALGIRGIVLHPAVLEALSPTYAFDFLFHTGWTGFFALTAVVLAFTGVEALYADMGHFGRPEITRAWLLLVFPACILSYLGQGALILDDPGAIAAPFFQLMPHAGLIPLVILATAATVIASQAVISGAFSLAHQATHLGYLPRLQIIHTSERKYGQVYVPVVNWLLMAAVLALVLTFQLGEARVRLRDGGHWHDHHHNGALLRHRPAPLAPPALARRERGHLLPHRRAGLLRVQPDKDRAWGLVSAVDRPHPVRGDGDLVPRPRAGRGRTQAARGLRGGLRHRPADARSAYQESAWDGRLHEPGGRRRRPSRCAPASITCTRCRSTRSSCRSKICRRRESGRRTASR
jgi:hypothetical protein